MRNLHSRAMRDRNRRIPASASLFPGLSVRHLPDAERPDAARQHMLPQTRRRAGSTIAGIPWAATAVRWLKGLEDCSEMSCLDGLVSLTHMHAQVICTLQVPAHACHFAHQDQHLVFEANRQEN